MKEKLSVIESMLSTIPVLFTLHTFSTALMSSGSERSLKIMICLAWYSLGKYTSTRFTHLFYCVLRDWYGYQQLIHNKITFPTTEVAVEIKGQALVY